MPGEKEWIDYNISLSIHICILYTQFEKKKILDIWHDMGVLTFNI